MNRVDAVNRVDTVIGRGTTNGHDAATHVPAASTPPRSGAHRRALAAIRWYQIVREGRPSPCRFTPSCSSYAYEAFELHGTRRGVWLTLRRLVRCRPFGPSGFDPVPEPGSPARRSPGEQAYAADRAHRCDHPDRCDHPTCKDC